MTIAQKIIFSLLATFLFSGSALAASLDDLYRDIIRSDNEGYLPLFVKNRAIPDIFMEKEVLKNAVLPEENKLKTPNQKELNLTNDAQEKDAARQAKQLKWEQTLQAVAENRVTPLDLDEINYRAGLDDAKAIEVLAWMYSKGIGVEKNFIAAFKLYLQAEKLQVPAAKENAILVFKAMTPDQRDALKN